MKTETIRDFLNKLQPWLPSNGDKYFPKKLTAAMLRCDSDLSYEIRSKGTVGQWIEILEALDKVKEEMEADELFEVKAPVFHIFEEPLQLKRVN